MFLPKRTFRVQKTFPSFFLTVNLGYYCMYNNRFQTLQLTRCSAVISNVAPPHASCFDYVTFRPYFLSINQPDRHLICMHIPFLFFSWTFVCVTVTLCRSLLIDILSLLAPQLDIYQYPLHSLPFLVLA